MPKRLLNVVSLFCSYTGEGRLWFMCLSALKMFHFIYDLHCAIDISVSATNTSLSVTNQLLTYLALEISVWLAKPSSFKSQFHVDRQQQLHQHGYNDKMKSFREKKYFKL